ncbi:HPr kinase/phosphorylase HprK [Gottschalkia acidurici 9a]|uniref:HPr kinase/phosphorylase n=1 Tax=Gottschalkia acidurici (strain ATCC 7906 / DSM 604 / BCRC 14475 / CIP 104303 / KCTC 5404 / NCIMB 10678 / 9a) TaxID=1128398 RepID=K0AZ09_GOTA9|nr:HPr(Ser) kinase/phosphatase [Gottschalkia acidurici]AFS79038.1 HPr kinase/phosphorylase HprK [Gottschalkia acidurici 9a]
MKTISIHELIQNMKLETVYMPDTIKGINISGSEASRPGLQLTGFFKVFPHDKIQVLGHQEIEYMMSLDYDLRVKRLRKIFEYPIPAMIITGDHKVLPEIIEFAKEFERPLFKTELPATKFISKLLAYLDDLLAPRTTIHGVLVEVFGMGTLIIGKSGVGKSETALELLKRGHRLVADDAVEITRVDEMLKGTSPELIRHFMEIRGIGILDIKRLYGFGAVKKWEAVDLAVELEHWDEQKEYDRVGLDENYIEILGLKIPKVTVPVKPGRNLAMIVEVAARNNRQKQFGYNAAEELDKKLKEELGKKRKELEEQRS